MKNNDIKKLLLNLRDDSPFLEELRRRFFPRQKSLSPADRLVFPMRDPAFRVHFASAYAAVGKFLPDEVWCSYIWRAWSHLLYPGQTKDPVGCEAMALGHPANRAVQCKLKGLLCACKDYDEVAKWSRIPREIVEVYSRWYFDFLNRRDDGRFVAAVLNPKNDLKLFPRERSRDSALLLMQLGYQQGPEAVVRAHGTKDEWNGDDCGDRSANIKQVLLADVETKAKMGMLDAGDPDFIYFKGLSIVEAKNQLEQESEDMRMGFGRISSDQGAQLVIRQITERAALKKLRAAQEYDAREAAATQAKRKAAEGVAAGSNNVAQDAT